MSITYTPTTNFGSKDVLPANDPNKVIVGAEFTSEFNAIQAAFALAAPTSNPTFSGTATYNNLNVTGTSTLGVLNAGTTTVGTFTSTGIDDNATSTAITIDAAENVGIGNTNPTSKLTIGDGTADAAIQFPCATKNNFIGYDGSFDGLQLASNGEIKFQAGTSYTERMRLDANGNLGIGTDSPVSSGSTFGSVTASGSAGGEYYVATGGTAKGNFFNYTVDVNQVGLAAVDPAGELVFSTGGYNERMRIDSSGNVGIGTSNPTPALGTGLHIDSSGYTAINLQKGTAGTGHVIDFSDASNNLQYRIGTNFLSGGEKLLFATPSAIAMAVDASGNVGIGDDNPVAKLQQYEASGTSHWLLDGNVSTSVPYGGYVKGYSTAGQGGRLELGTVDNSAESTAMTILETGSVGIGTSSPASSLHVKGPEVRVDNTGAPSNGYVRFMNDSGSMSVGMTGANENSLLIFDRANNQNASKFTGGASGSWDFMTNGAERMRIDAAGNVGIGTSSPIAELEVHNNISMGDGTSVTQLAMKRNTANYIAATDPAGYLVFRTGGSDERMRIDPIGRVGIGTSQPGSYNTNANDLVVGLSGTGGNRGLTIASGSTSFGTLAFANGPTGNDLARQFIRADHGSGAMLFATAAGEKMRLDASGNLLVGSTSVPSTVVTGSMISNVETQPCRFSGSGVASRQLMLFINPNGSVGSISTSGSATSYTTSSDERLKENIVDAPAGNLDALKVRSFDWKADGEHQDYGFIAQELETVAPYAVTKGQTDEDMWGVDYSKLVPMLVKEIQDLKAKVEALENA